MNCCYCDKQDYVSARKEFYDIFKEDDDRLILDEINKKLDELSKKLDNFKCPYYPYEPKRNSEGYKLIFTEDNNWFFTT
jgi:hypothetical protein